ncbi:RNA-binding protein [bacterium]|nr:RNA-binding protein [bacterium]
MNYLVLVSVLFQLLIKGMFYFFIFFIMNIYVGNLSYNVSEAELKELFGEYGSVHSVKIINDKFTGKSKGFGFIEMEDDGGRAAIDGLNGQDEDGRALKVNEARPREDNRGGDNRGGGGGGRW